MPKNFEVGPLDKRLEAMVNDALDGVINEVARELAGGKSPKMFRSRAVRKLLIEAAEAREAKAARTAKRVGV